MTSRIAKWWLTSKAAGSEYAAYVDKQRHRSAWWARIVINTARPTPLQEKRRAEKRELRERLRYRRKIYHATVQGQRQPPYRIHPGIRRLNRQTRRIVGKKAFRRILKQSPRR